MPKFRMNILKPTVQAWTITEHVDAETAEEAAKIGVAKHIADDPKAHIPKGTIVQEIHPISYEPIYRDPVRQGDFKSEVREIVATRATRKGGTVVKNGLGRKSLRKKLHAIPTGYFVGEVFYEISREETANYGSGPETRTVVERITVAEIPKNPDRAIVERRTAAILAAFKAGENL